MAAGFRKHNGGDTVRFGFYWNLAEWEAQIVPKEGGQLKGALVDRYGRARTAIGLLSALHECARCSNR